MKVLLLFSATGLVIIQATLAQSPAPLFAPESEIRALLVERVDERKQSVGIVVGVIEPAGKRVLAYGRPAKNDARPLDGASVFQIGSVTKVFTSLLLSDMVQHGEVKLDDPVSMYLPKGVTMPVPGGSRITLRHLATHTSGLPRDPSNPSSPDPDNPYLGYSIEQLYQFLSTYKLTRKVGSQYEYSNLGGGLLGHILAKCAGVDYATLVKTRICDPFDMNSTRAHVTADMNKRLVTGHSEKLDPVPALDLAVIPGASVLRSTVNDLLIFLAAVLGYEKTPLAPAMAAMLDHPQSTGTPGSEIALGWHLSTINGTRFVRHNGGLEGCGSFIGYDPKSRVGVVVLSNSETTAVADQIGFHLLDQQAQRRGADEKTETGRPHNPPVQ